MYEAMWKGHSNVLNIILHIYVDKEKSKGFVTLMQGGIQLSDDNSMFQQDIRLDNGIDKGRCYKRERKIVKCTNGLTMKDREVNIRGVLHDKVWIPSELKGAMKDDSNKIRGQW